MTAAIGVSGMVVEEFALRLSALRGTAAYAVYLAEGRDLEAALTDLEDEIRTLTPEGDAVRISPRNAEQLIIDLSARRVAA